MVRVAIKARRSSTESGNPVDVNGKSLTVRNLSYGYTRTVRKVQGATKEGNIFGLDRKSIKAATPEIINVACTGGSEGIEILVESPADLAQIENKSSHRKAVCEMALDPSRELQPELRHLLTQIDQAKASQSVSKDHEITATKLVVDLQAQKRIIPNQLRNHMYQQ